MQILKGCGDGGLLPLFYSCRKWMAGWAKAAAYFPKRQDSCTAHRPAARPLLLLLVLLLGVSMATGHRCCRSSLPIIRSLHCSTSASLVLAVRCLASSSLSSSSFVPSPPWSITRRGFAASSASSSSSSSSSSSAVTLAANSMGQLAGKKRPWRRRGGGDGKAGAERVVPAMIMKEACGDVLLLRHAVDGEPLAAGMITGVLSAEEWRKRAQAHSTRVLGLLGGSLKHDTSNPIANFLFQYYHFRPKALVEYSPGMGVVLHGAHPGDPLLAKRGGVPVVSSNRRGAEEAEGGGVVFVPYGPEGGVSAKHETALRLTLEIIRNTAQRPPIFFCYGAHEWAMLYRPPGAATEPKRYQQLPLRVSQEVLNEYVESRPIRCTHFDAFRFFTPEARPLNVYGPQLAHREEAQPLMEQPGCLHANMDLFKWSVKLGPYAPSELVGRALELAIACRVLDMRASPYDLTSKWEQLLACLPEHMTISTRPVAIETAEGRAEYQWEQEELARRAEPIRRELIQHYERYLRAIGQVREQQQQQPQQPNATTTKQLIGG